MRRISILASADMSLVAARARARGRNGARMAPVDRRVRMWAWLVRQQGSVGTKTEAEVIAMQSRHAPANGVTNRIFGTVVPGTGVANRAIAGPAGDIPVRIYRPARAGSGTWPLILNFHGGGFVFGDLRLADWMCSSVAVTVGAVVVSVDYRLAPRHRFPAAVDDCYAALVWAAENATGLGAGSPGAGGSPAHRGDGGKRRGEPRGGDVPAGPRPRRAEDQPSGAALPAHRHDADAAESGKGAHHPRAGHARLPAALPRRRRSGRPAGVPVACGGPHRPAAGADPGGRARPAAARMAPATPRLCGPPGCRYGSPSTSACRTATSTSPASAAARRRPWPRYAENRQRR